MGMTINEAIEWYNGLECYTPQAKDARDVAIKTMRKYQKIQEIYQKWNEVNDFDYNQAMLKIGKVLESEEIPND